ncbi:MAG: RNA methyltransferase [Bdellovibrionales bacterium]|nr:RNA methyltransferase [Bdellovibrionales bacterium]
MTISKTRIKKIESPSNSIYKQLLELSTSRGMQEHGQCLVSGEKIIEEHLSEASFKDMFWVFTSQEHSLFEKFELPQAIILPPELFKKLDVVGTRAPLLCRPLPQLETWSAESSYSGLQLLCALGDPNNLGALLRSALAFNVSSVVLLKECCHPFHPKVIKSSAGACFHIPLMTGPSINELPSNMGETLALDMTGSPLEKYSFPKNFRILLGEEGLGIPKNIPLKKLSIPMNDKVESLNATVAASLVFYAHNTQMSGRYADTF